MINHRYRIYYMMRAASIQQNVKTTEIFGGLDIFATLSFSLSQVLTYNSFPLYIARAGV